MVQRKNRYWKLAPTSEEGILLDHFPSLDKGSDCTDCSRWVDTGNKNDVFFDCNEDAIENSDSQTPPEDHHDDAIQESLSSAVEQTCENLTPNNPCKITVIGPQHPTLIRGDVDRTNILPFSRRPKALISIEDIDPLSYSSAVSGRKDSCHWIAAIAKELEMMKNLEVWDVVNLEPHHKLLGTTWVLRRKKSPITQTKYKAQLCAQGFAQTFGRDYSKSFAPTGRMHSLRTLIAFSVTNDLQFQQRDIQSAFLNAELEENVYLGIPQGLGFDKKKQCLKLKEAIYGLKQAPLAWYNRLMAWLKKKTGFTASVSHLCVFYCAKDSPIWLFFHVDDIAVFGKDVEPFKNQLKSEFDVKNMGNDELMLGIQMIQAPEGLVLSQAHYIESVLVLYGMENCLPVATPMVPGIHLTEESLDQQVAFKKLGVNY
ncbi:hypothetical protein O181_075897 [Austropuccinia psidii MF-1]|uniref:Reverse transcriptase Ty1/copia-type domain-containing protein n=1 Tax=Austropuccinia psidii MF-1 TaxID=1389203 RepID=A0A9Q3FDE4_9BASI|nr:hypothetical protein [Austropuccinia psidii MF-1]